MFSQRDKSRLSKDRTHSLRLLHRNETKQPEFNRDFPFSLHINQQPYCADLCGLCKIKVFSYISNNSIIILCMSQDWGHQQYCNLLVLFILFFHMQVCLCFLIKNQPVNYSERFILKNLSCQSHLWPAGSSLPNPSQYKAFLGVFWYGHQVQYVIIIQRKRNRNCIASHHMTVKWFFKVIFFVQLL